MDKNRYVFEDINGAIKQQGVYELAIQPLDHTWFVHGGGASLPQLQRLTYRFTVQGAAPARLKANWRSEHLPPVARMGADRDSTFALPPLKLWLEDAGGQQCSLEGLDRQRLKGMLSLGLEHSSLQLGTFNVEVRCGGLD